MEPCPASSPPGPNTGSFLDGSNFVTGAGLLGMEEDDLITAILREALTRPRYDAPLSAPDFVGRRMET